MFWICLIAVCLFLIAIGTCLFYIFHKIIEKRKKPYKTLGVLCIVLISIIPILINEAYILGYGYSTIWGAEDMLSFYGSILSFFGTVSLGIIALWQNYIFKQSNDDSQTTQDKLAKQANDINDRLVKIEEEGQMPVIDFYDYNSSFYSQEDHLSSISASLKKILKSFQTLKFLIRNITHVYINKIELINFKIYQCTNSSVFDELVFEDTDCHELYKGQLSAFEYKLFQIHIPPLLKNFENKIFHNLTTNAKLELVLRLSTFTGRSYCQTVSFESLESISKDTDITQFSISNKNIQIFEEMD